MKKDEVKEMQESGYLYLVETIQAINEANSDYDMEESEIYLKFLQCLTVNKEDEEVKRVASNYLFGNYAIRKLYNIHNTSLNDFDRQSLKLSSIISDMYLIENNISKILETKNKMQDVIGHYQAKLKELTSEETASSVFKEEENNFLNVSEKAINELRNNDDYISKNAESESIIGLIKIIFNTFSVVMTTEIFLNAIYKIFDLKEKLTLENIYKLGSYTDMKIRKDNLFKLAEDNQSIGETFKKSQLYLLLNEYTSLDKTITSEMLNRQSDLIKEEIEKYLKSAPVREDVEITMTNFLKECQVNFKKEMGW